MATAPKKTVVVNPAPPLSRAPATPAAVEASQLRSRPRPRSLTELQGNLRSVVEKGLAETRARLTQSEERGGRDRQRG